MPAVAQRAGWPFRGRDYEMAALVHLYAGGASKGAVLAGTAGIGKTRLADEAASELGVVGVHRIVGSEATQTVPYAALAHLLGGDQVDMNDPRAVISAVRGVVGDQRMLLIADDVAWLDDASISVCTQLLSLGSVFLLATLRDDVTVSDALDAMIRTFDLRRLDLVGLDVAAVSEIANAALGAPADQASVAALVDRCAGNPLYITELLQAAIADHSVEALPSGEVSVRLAGRSDTPRLRELLRTRLGRLDAAHLDALRFMAVAEPLLITDLTAADLLDHMTALEQMGWLRVDGESVRLAHPLHRDALLADLGVLAYRQLAGRAADLVDARHEQHHDDALRVAIWRLDAGQRPDTKTLLRGARQARAAVDLASTLRLSRAAHDQDGSFAARHMLMEALFLTGQFTAAEQLGALPIPVDTNPFAVFGNQMLRMSNVLWGHASAARAIEVVESAREFLTTHDLAFLLNGPLGFVRAHNAQSALALELLGEEHPDDLPFLSSALARTRALCAQGRFAESIHTCDRAIAILSAKPDPSGSMNPSMFIMQRAVAYNAVGRYDESISTCTEVYGSIVDQRIALVRCFMGLGVGYAALATGEASLSKRWFDEMLAATAVVKFPTARRTAFAGLATLAGQTGDVVASAMYLDELDQFVDEVALGRADGAIGRAWALSAVGRIGDARSLLRAAVELELADGEPLSVLHCLVEAARLGDGAWAAALAVANHPVLERMEGPLVAAQLAFLRAHEGRGGRPFFEVAKEFEQLGANVLAAECFALASQGFERDAASRSGASTVSAADVRMRAAARSSASALAARCSGFRTPAMAGADVAVLSSRELEVARLAAAGHPSRDIAGLLYLSARTVENHLQRVYVKLGVSGRDELAAHPALSGRGSPDS